MRWKPFDLKSDPQEMGSAYSNPKYAVVRKDLEKELARRRSLYAVPDKEDLITPVKGSK
jgi:hypothetical protein